MSIHAGSLLRADGGVIVMEAGEVLASPGAWAALVRTLRSGRVELVPPDIGFPWLAPAIKPEPVEVNVKVVLLGESMLYYLLDRHDVDFPNLFKVLADFDSTMPRDASSVQLYAGVLARIAKTESLPPFSADAVAALAEHGARVAASRGKLTARFGRLADIAREAAYLARKGGAAQVDASLVLETVRRTKSRAAGPVRRFREALAEGSIRVATRGTEVGQVNGLAVIQAGPLTYGFPTRITATVGPGAGGAINIDREAQLSGAIHTKAFFILGGLLRYLLQTDHPLTFDASIAFEQSYGGIDGDSASGAEICCLLSALTGLPLRPELAMTGAIDQMGNVLAIGAVNEKVEGFFDACRVHGLTGAHGVIIPAANVGDLMLRHDVVEACERGEFAVYAVDWIGEAVSLFFDREAGARRAPHPSGSVLAVAVERARLLYDRAEQRSG
jgi:predicted ATP-dependent protease